MPEGATLVLASGYVFTITYAGGDGNDIVLTSINGRQHSSVTLTSSNPAPLAGQPVTFTATVTASGTPTGTVTFRDGNFPLAMVTVSGGTATFTTSALDIGTHNITATYSGDGSFGTSQSAVLIETVTAGLPAPSAAKTFDPTTIVVGGISRLTITLGNPNTQAITGAAFVDSYPANLVNASAPNVVSTCGGTVTAVAGSSSLTLTGGVIPASSSCSVSVLVTASANGTMTNVLPAGAVTSANALATNTQATATLTVSPATAIPAASMTMLMLLGVALATAASLILRR
ncbi:MAG TPA: Ig-like domain-containing protein [Thermoanaerobaculia bacterium]